MAGVAVDISWARDPATLLYSLGVRVVMRYLGHDTTGKVLTAGEARSYIDAGLAIGPNFEDSINNALMGEAKGRADATFANKLADGIGCPRDVMIWYSCDTGATLAQILPYYQAVAQTSFGVRPVGFYGGHQLGVELRRQGLVSGVWVANAASWSGEPGWPQLAAHALADPLVNMVQHLNHPLAGIPAGDYDYNDITNPFPVWGRQITGQGAEDLSYSQWNDLEKIAMWRDIRNVVIGVLRGDPFLSQAGTATPDTNLAGLVKDNTGDPGAPHPTKLSDIHESIKPTRDAIIAAITAAINAKLAAAGGSVQGVTPDEIAKAVVAAEGKALSANV